MTRQTTDNLHQAAWIIVFTYIVVTLVLVIAEEITRATGVYCETSSKPAFAHFWVSPILVY